MNPSLFDVSSAEYVEQLYQSYLDNTASVPPAWAQYFASLELSSTPSLVGMPHIDGLVQAYRQYGHEAAQLDPLGLVVPTSSPRLDPMRYGVSVLDSTVHSLKKIYASTKGFEYQHISNEEERDWLTQAIEQGLVLSSTEKKQVLNDLIAAEGLERHLGRKYVGQKRFSLEGGGSLIPLLNDMLHCAADYGVKEVMMGMAHRGRLNVLINILGKKPADLFGEFEGKYPASSYSGDVKYHKGYSSNLLVNGKSVHLSLAFNPSHLEIVSPVVAGAVRAKLERRQAKDTEVLPITIHGDASFAGQGVVMETFAMSQTRGYGVGGTVRIVINNQVGFTTHQPKDTRSSLYCTDVAKMLNIPIFHVNGDDPEAVVFVGRLALAYRQRFHKDAVIDLVCFRKHGHNESDEPSATQPLMYKTIKTHRSVNELYAKQLVHEKIIDEQEHERWLAAYQQRLEEGDGVALASADLTDYPYAANWQPHLGHQWRVPVTTAISHEQFCHYAKAMTTLPNGFVLQAQVGKMMKDREKMASGDSPIDWGFAETLAYASLVVEGYPVRLSGEDSGRGTFAHRHAVLHQQETGEVYIPLQHVAREQASFTVIDSLLSEEAVLAFEYGFSAAEPNNLVIWEAQFGDFANGAQVVIDQFISSGEQKWARLSGLVMLLPHGYEGMGPEHSSARLERYLQLCAQDNMQVCTPTTPAQIFHLLRRQMRRPCRLPLVVMSPKSMLRAKAAVSSIEDIVTGQFQLVIPESAVFKKVTRVIFCAGKVYYDLLAKREEANITDTALVRIEQLYPFPVEEVQAELARYAGATDIVWCQEEPKNQGAWSAVRDYMPQSMRYAGRLAAAAPSTGAHATHVREQQQLVNDAFMIGE